MPRIDFTDAFPQDIDVVLPDGTYPFPGDVTVEETVALMDACEAFETADTGQTSLQAGQVLEGLLLTHFRRRTPDMERLPVPARLLIPFMYAIFAGGDPEDDEAVDPPGADEAASTTTKNSGSPRPKAANRKRTTKAR